MRLFQLLPSLPQHPLPHPLDSALIETSPLKYSFGFTTWVLFDKKYPLTAQLHSLTRNNNKQYTKTFYVNV